MGTDDKGKTVPSDTVIRDKIARVRHDKSADVAFSGAFSARENCRFFHTAVESNESVGTGKKKSDAVKTR